MRWVKNFGELAVTTNRRLALEIVEAAYDAIDTEKSIEASVFLQDNILHVQDQKFDLERFKGLKVIGFGKAAGRAAKTLEKILGARITGGAVITLAAGRGAYIDIFQGTHPRASAENVLATRRILKIARAATKDDLILVIVSGGGSALFCWPEDECEQGQRLYDEFLKTGGTIEELNTVRKHISLLKGGGLAKILYPATVVGLIFSDVPGANYKMIASGPTFKSPTTIEDAERIIKKYQLGEYRLRETPKADRYFEKVTNVLIVSNEKALHAMKWRAGELGFKATILANEIYGFVPETARMFFEAAKPGEFLLGGGEPRLSVAGQNTGGSGGRNLFLGLHALGHIQSNQVFVSFASDGMDNCDAAGAVVDLITKNKMIKKNLDLDDYIRHYDALTFFEQTGDIIMTGPTEANVSDLMVLFENNGTD